MEALGVCDDIYWAVIEYRFAYNVGQKGPRPQPAQVQTMLVATLVSADVSLPCLPKVKVSFPQLGHAKLLARSLCCRAVIHPLQQSAHIAAPTQELKVTRSTSVSSSPQTA